MRRAALLDEPVERERASFGLRPLLESRLGVEAVEAAEVERRDVVGEEASCDRPGGVQARVESEGGHDGLERVCQACVAVAATRPLLSRRHAQSGAEVEPARQIREVVLGHEDGPRLRERSFRLEGKRVEEKLGDEVVQDAVAEELERLVVLCVGVFVRVGRVRQGPDEEPLVAEAPVERALDGVEGVVHDAEVYGDRRVGEFTFTMGSRAPSEDAESGEVTAILRAWSQGDPEAPDRLLPLVYRHLRCLAASQMRKERANHTLQPTALVHEAYLKLVDQHLSWKDRGHFYGVAARAMRQVLVDHARRRDAGKRGAGAQRVELEIADVAVPSRAIDLLALDRSLEDLARLDERQARLVELRLFAGLSVQESADVLGCSSATASRDYRHAEAWLRRQMRGTSA